MPEFFLFRQGAAKNLFPLAARKKAGVISIIPLGQAAWGTGLRDQKTLAASLRRFEKLGHLPKGKFPKPEKALDFLLDGKTKSVAAAALRFCLSFPAVSTVCCGTNDPAHIAENAAVSDQGPYEASRLAKAKALFGRLHHDPDEK
jgi:aryl-alcohol dehydrogenase-like predicted oxidoreductase